MALLGNSDLAGRSPHASAACRRKDLPLFRHPLCGNFLQHPQNKQSSWGGWMYRRMHFHLKTGEMSCFWWSSPTRSTRLLKAAAKPVKLPDNECVVLAQSLLRFGQPQSLCPATADLVFEDLLAPALVRAFMESSAERLSLTTLISSRACVIGARAYGLASSLEP